MSYATHGKQPDNDDVEMTYGDHLRDMGRSNSTADGKSGSLEQDEREIRRMGKISQFKVLHEHGSIGERGTDRTVFRSESIEDVLCSRPAHRFKPAVSRIDDHI
jgi:hypothetical protein